MKDSDSVTMERFRLEEGCALPRPAGGAVKRTGVKAKFIRGPIDLDWIAAAAQIPGRALHVAVILCFLAGIEGTDRIRLRSSLTKRFGLTRSTVYRALSGLEQAGLIRVTRRRGANPMVELVGHRPS